MGALPEPNEIYEWRDGETKDLTVLRHETGQMTIHPRDGRPPKEVEVLRLHVPEEEKPEYPQYWDMTSKRLVGQLKQILPGTYLGPFRIRIQAIGRPPATHYSVTRIPEG